MKLAVRLRSPPHQYLRCPSGRLHQRLVQYPQRKYSAVVLTQITSSIDHPTRQEGRLAIVTNVRWDAMDAIDTTDERD
jgi:hypothetical protein